MMTIIVVKLLRGLFTFGGHLLSVTTAALRTPVFLSQQVNNKSVRARRVYWKCKLGKEMDLEYT